MAAIGVCLDSVELAGQIDKGGKYKYNDSAKPPWRNWHTRQVEDLCPQGRGGSNPLGGTTNFC
jgi:hypothetical protein